MCRSCYRAHEFQSYFTSVDDGVDVCCPCEALVEDDAEKLHRPLHRDRDVIDFQDDICRAVLASSEENGDRLVDGDLEFFSSNCV